MKKLYLLLPLLCLYLCNYGQWPKFYTVTFDNTNYINQFYFDTLQNPNCKWQIGKPSKTVFNAAYSAPNALLTDTLNPLPANDTSVFYFYHPKQVNYFFYMEFFYKLDGDSTSFGAIELSPNKGQNWVNLHTDDTLYDIDWCLPKPTLKGSTNGWEYLCIDMFNWNTDYSNTYPLSLQNADTVIYRFTYISGNIPGDGWMIDDLMHGDHLMSVEEFSLFNNMHIYPNPHQNSFTLHVKEPVFSDISITVRNTLGTVCYQHTITGKEHYVSTETWAKGVYLVEAFSENILLGRQKLIKQ